MDPTKSGCQNEGVNPFVSEMNILVLQVCASVMESGRMVARVLACGDALVAVALLGALADLVKANLQELGLGWPHRWVSAEWAGRALKDR